MENNPQIQPSPPIAQPETHPIQPQSSPKYPSKTKWILIAVILVAVLIISIGGAYFFIPNFSKNTEQTGNQTSSGQTIVSKAPDTNDTASWKTLTSKKVYFLVYPGYTLKHNSDWIEKYSRTDKTTQLTLSRKNYSIYYKSD